ncbi:RNA polymerase-binding protein DksA [Methylibium rhizosphaerae]|uniref:RNA polymerase-binding protein DksA n=1 Tax=Methylibium rhizosphaerae TaxID=2570323 RepID=UPI00112B11CE|nr:RNA polymerase-binding protein DksA [Methylibium rhizosphaerae]
MSKTTAQRATSTKPAAKPAAKKATASSASAAKAKPASKAPAEAAAKTAVAKAPAKPAAKPAPKAAPAAPAAKAAPVHAKPAPAPAPVAPAAAATRPAPLGIPSRPMNTVVNDFPKPTIKVDPKLANVWKSKPGRELTDAEVLAMPDSEYMNDKQLEFFRTKLQRQREDLLENAGETTEHLREDTSIVPDPADRATIEEEHALELRTRDRERKLLKKISQALARIDAGEYGYCDETGEPIGLGRLIARPTATLSLEAQQRREMKQKMFGD